MLVVYLIRSAFQDGLDAKNKRLWRCVLGCKKREQAVDCWADVEIVEYICLYVLQHFRCVSRSLDESVESPKHPICILTRWPCQFIKELSGNLWVSKNAGIAYRELMKGANTCVDGPNSSDVVEEFDFQGLHGQKLEQLIRAAAAHEVAKCFHIRDHPDLCIEQKALREKTQVDWLSAQALPVDGYTLEHSKGFSSILSDGSTGGGQWGCRAIHTGRVTSDLAPS